MKKGANDLPTFLTPPQTDLEREKCSSEDFKVNGQTLDTSATVTENKRAPHAWTKSIDHLIKGRLGGDMPGKTRSLLIDK